MKTPEEFKKRQATFVLEREASATAARERLANEFGEDEAAALVADAGSQHPAIFNVLKNYDLGISQDALAREINEFGQLQPARYAGGLRIAYFVAVFVVLVAVFYLFQLYLVPQFSSLFASFGGELPALTRWVYNIPTAVMLALPWIILILAVLSYLNAQQVLRLRRRPSWFSARISPYRATIKLHIVLVFLWLIRLLRTNGSEPEGALEKAREMTGEYASETGWSRPVPHSVDSDLGISARLGTLDEEIEYRIETTLHNFSLRVVAVNQGVTALVHLLIGAAILIFLVATYLPIFSMGKVI